jgi:hypothetical protein
MFNVVGHHRQHRARKKEAEIPMLKRRKRGLLVPVYPVDLNSGSSHAASNYTSAATCVGGAVQLLKHPTITIGYLAEKDRKKICDVYNPLVPAVLADR